MRPKGGQGKESTHPPPGRVVWKLEFWKDHLGCWWWSGSLPGAQGRGKEGRQLEPGRDPGSCPTRRTHGVSWRATSSDTSAHQSWVICWLLHLLAWPASTLGQLLTFSSLGFLICQVRMLIPPGRYAIQLRDTEDTLLGTLTFNGMCPSEWVCLSRACQGKKLVFSFPQSCTKHPPGEALARVLAPMWTHQVVINIYG